MEKSSPLTKNQKIILDEVSRNRVLTGQFYFGGGTALSKFYLNHRYSDDLDFFSLKKFDTQIIFTILTEWSKKRHFHLQSQFIDPVYICILDFGKEYFLRLDFAYYPYQQLQKGSFFLNLKVDSLFDIAVNKLLSVTQRTEVKDFVDLFFLLKEFTISDLIAGVKKKFDSEIEPLTLASHFVLAKDFEFLPRMIKPLTLTELKKFFYAQAETLGKRFLS